MTSDVKIESGDVETPPLSIAFNLKGALLKCHIVNSEARRQRDVVGAAELNPRFAQPLLGTVTVWNRVPLVHTRAQPGLSVI